MRKLARLIGGALLVALAVRIIDWFVAPALPLLMTVLVIVGLWSVLVGGRPR